MLGEVVFLYSIYMYMDCEVDCVGEVVCGGLGDVVWCDGVDGGVSGGEDSDKVELLILSCWGVLLTDWLTDRRTNGHWWL